MTLTPLTLAAAALCLGIVARPAAGIEKRVVTAADASADDESQPSVGANTKKKRIIVEAVEPGRGKRVAKETAWLGVSVEETSEALASQLGLESGEGLVVEFVAPDSPAAKAGLKRNDVLVQLGDQVLVHPVQLRKLVQMHKEGDSVDLTYFRNGKKQTLSIKLGKTVAEASPLMNGAFGSIELGDLNRRLADLDINGKVQEQMKVLKDSLAKAGIDRQKMNIEIRQSMENARAALKDALSHKGHAGWVFGPGAKDLENLASGGMDLEKGATVVVKNDGKSVKTMVKADDSGTYVIVANPKKRLTVHDQDGKLLFDGAIDTSEDQGKVPKDLWDRVKPMLDQMGPVKSEQPEANEDSDSDPNS
jgi:hypothetical protein